MNRHVVPMKGRAEIVKRSVRIAGHATSVSLEPAFWDALCEIAARRHLSLNALLSRIDAEREGNLSSAIRLFVLASCRGELDDAAAAMPPLADPVES
jgi:predicted DNA-binding ribbon-helix-helix protein